MFRLLYNFGEVTELFFLGTVQSIIAVCSQTTSFCLIISFHKTNPTSSALSKKQSRQSSEIIQKIDKSPKIF